MPVVSFTDGGRTGLACERPQLIVRDGVLSHLIVGGIPTGLRIDSGESVDDSAEQYGWPGGATMVIPLQ